MYQNINLSQFVNSPHLTNTYNVTRKRAIESGIRRSAMSEYIVAVEDDLASHPIATDWRPMFAEVVERFVKGDFSLSRPVSGVFPVDPDVATHNKDYVTSYGQPLANLIDKVWDSSCAQWMGSHWDIIIDLCTATEGISDLVLTGKVAKVDGKPMFTVGLIYVP